MLQIDTENFATGVKWLMASTAWNNAKLNARYTYYKALHSCSLCTNSSLRDTAMPL